jgi:hypothetical protein
VLCYLLLCDLELVPTPNSKFSAMTPSHKKMWEWDSNHARWSLDMDLVIEQRVLIGDPRPQRDPLGERTLINQQDGGCSLPQPKQGRTHHPQPLRPQVSGGSVHLPISVPTSAPSPPKTQRLPNWLPLPPPQPTASAPGRKLQESTIHRATYPASLPELVHSSHKFPCASLGYVSAVAFIILFFFFFLTCLLPLIIQKVPSDSPGQSSVSPL